MSACGVLGASRESNNMETTLSKHTRKVSQSFLDRNTLDEKKSKEKKQDQNG